MSSKTSTRIPLSLTPAQLRLMRALGFRVTIELSQEELEWLKHFEARKNWENTKMIVTVLRKLRNAIRRLER